MLSSYWRLLRDCRNFRLLWFAQIISEIGDWFYALSVYSLLLELTGNQAQSVGLAVVLQVLPQTFVSPTAGVVNDRARRKSIMIGADVARFAIVLGMLLVRTPGMVWLVYPLLLLETVGAAFFEPARSSVVPNIVPEHDITSANALGAITWSFSLAAGSMLGGLVAAVAGRDVVFILNALSFLASAWLIRRMRFEEPHVTDNPPLQARELVDFSPILAGMRYIAADRRRLATVFVKGGVGLLGANNVLLPILGARVFPLAIPGLPADRTAMLGMSILLGARGVGSLLGPLISGVWAGDDSSRLRRGIVWGFLLAAAGYLWLGASGSFAAAAVAVVLGHGGASSNWVFSTSLLQQNTEDRYRGRVFSADLGICMAAISASSYAAGIALDWGMAPRHLATVIGLVMIVPALAWMAALRATGGTAKIDT
jgi:MFS family permease